MTTFYIEIKYGNKSRLSRIVNDSLMLENKTEDVYADISNDKEMFDFSNSSTKSKYFDNSKKLVVFKMKNEATGVMIEKFVGLKPTIHSHLVDDNSEHEIAKDVNKHAAATIGHNEYKDVLLNKKCLGHLMNRIQRKDHKNGTYEINSVSYFDEKIYIQNNGFDGLALHY